MRPDEITPDVMLKIGDVLKIAAAYDQRTVGKADVKAWALAVGQYDEDALTDAVVTFYVERATDDKGRRPFITPGDVVKLVRSVRKDRLARVPLPAPESAEPGEYLADLQRMIRRVADGMAMPAMSPRRVLEYGGPPPKAIATPEQPGERPERTAEQEETYGRARGVLAARRDRGGALLELAREQLGADADAAELVVRAAELDETYPEPPVEHKEAS